MRLVPLLTPNCFISSRSRRAIQPHAPPNQKAGAHPLFSSRRPVVYLLNATAGRLAHFTITRDMTTPFCSFRRDEAVPGTLLSVHLFLSVASIVLGKAARDAILLSRSTPQQMTEMDIATMFAVTLVVGAQLRMNAHMSTKRLLLISPLCFAIGDLGLWFGLSMSSGAAMPLVAYLWIGIQASFGAPQASVLASHVLTLRQAKRLCGVIGAGAILGWIGGGLLTHTLAARFGVSCLLLGSGALTALCPLVVSLIWRDGSETPPEAGGRDHMEPSGGLQRSASAVWTSPHLRAIACLALVSSAVTTIVGLQFKIVASRSIGASNDLAAFFGSFSIYAGLVALATQVLLTSRIVGSLGLHLALMIAPAALAAGSVGILYSGTLASAVFLKGSDQVLRYSVDRAAVELLYRPLSKREIFEGKTFIDALVCRLGDAMGGVIVLVGTIGLRLNFSWLGVISLALLLGWLLSARVARQRYRARLRDNLRRQPHEQDEASTSGPATLERKPFGRRRGQRDIMNGDPAKRLDALHSLARARAHRPQMRVDKKLLTTALAAEIVGFAVLVETCAGSGGSSNDDRYAGRDALERIATLLFLISPDRYPDCIRWALRSGDPVNMAAVVEYLDVTLPAPHRELLISLLERWPAAVI